MDVGRITLFLLLTLFIFCFCNNSNEQAKNKAISKSTATSEEKDWFSPPPDNMSIIKNLHLKAELQQEGLVTDSKPETLDRPQNTTAGGTEAPKPKGKSKITLYEGLASSFVFIFLSEVGDKTFVYLMICTSTMNILELFIISNLALGGMHILGTLFGSYLQNFISIFWLKIVSIIIFLYFGIHLIYEGLNEEDEEIDQKINHAKVEMIDGEEKLIPDQENDRDVEDREKNEQSCWQKFKKGINRYQVLGVFGTILALEMGDMSQFSAIILAANFGVWAVIIGGLVGHGLAICIALCFGKVLLTMISEKAMHIAGGVGFLAFSVFTIISLIMGSNYE